MDKDGAEVVEGEEEAWEADCAKKSGEKGLTYLWSRNPPPRWQQPQEGALTWAPASGAERVGGALW